MTVVVQGSSPARPAALLTLLTVLFGTALHAQTPSTSSSCEKLAALALPGTTITLAQVVEAGAFTPPAPASGPQPAAATLQFYAKLPAFCRVAATLKPSADSDIKIEVWLPAAGWNGKFQGVGNGGWAGTITYRALGTALQSGYAAASTDTGHVGTGGDGSFAHNHPEKLVDFAYRAVHEMTVQAKAIISAYYGKAPRLSYWNGCSTGGRQGLKEAQRYPADYDGIVSIAPANYLTRLNGFHMWTALSTHKGGKNQLPTEKLAVVHRAAMEACDGLDGVKDGVLEDPSRCRFDPKSLACAGDETAACLTAPQLEAVRRLYGPARLAKTGAEFFPGLEPGSEAAWMPLTAGPGPFNISYDMFRYVVLKDPAWNYEAFDPDKHIALADAGDNNLLNATDPNLEPFFDRGGKLLMFHGWTDQLIPPRNTINYYNSVVKAMGGEAKISNSIRLFMVPGFAHCGGGPGPNVFDAVAALDQWVEQKKAPNSILASHLTNGAVDRTRPLCPYPQVAAYKGSGSTDDAVNFVCQAR